MHGDFTDVLGSKSALRSDKVASDFGAEYALASGEFSEPIRIPETMNFNWQHDVEHDGDCQFVFQKLLDRDTGALVPCVIVVYREPTRGKIRKFRLKVLERQVFTLPPDYKWQVLGAIGPLENPDMLIVYEIPVEARPV